MEGQIYIIIPAYNEASVIAQTLAALQEYKHSVIVVDDGSTDDIKAVLKKTGVHYIKHDVNLGQGAALKTGIRYALKKGVDYLVTFDADGQHNAADIEGALQFMKSKSLDIVFGSRFLATSKTNISFTKKLLLQGARFLNFLASGILLTDAHNGFRVFNRSAASTLELFENRMSHATEILVQVKQHKLKYAEYPVTIHYTPYSRQKGQKLIHSFKVIQDIILHKIFR